MGTRERLAITIIRSLIGVSIAGIILGAFYAVAFAQENKLQATTAVSSVPDVPATPPPLPAVAAKMETKELDEVTRLRMQNGLLRIQKAQADITVAQMEVVQANEQANRELEKFYKANGLVQDEWILDQQRLILVRKPKQ